MGMMLLAGCGLPRDADGTLEIVLTTFDHGLDVYTVPGSGTGCLPWPTGRGNTLRNGMGPATAP